MWLLQGFLTADETLRTKWVEATTDLAQINETVQEDMAHFIIKVDLNKLMKTTIQKQDKTWSDLKSEEKEKEVKMEAQFEAE